MGVKVLYILSSRHSGNTILGNLLGEIDGFFHAGDLRAVWKRGLLEGRQCGCGAPVPECPVWSAVFAGLLPPDGDGRARVREVVRWQREAVDRKHAARLMRMRASELPDWPALNGYADAVGPLYRAIARVTGARVVVEASKEEADVALLRLLEGVDPFVVQLVRDPRAVDYSWRRRAGRVEEARDRLPVVPGWTARGWASKNRRAEAVRRWLGPDRSMVVRYEDLVGDPGGALEAVTAMVGEPADRLPLEGRTALLGVNHTAAGNRNRFRTGRVELRMDGEWLTHQRSADRWIATMLAFPWLGRYGYPVRPGAGS